MGTKVHCKSHTPGYYSICDMNENSSSSIWSPFHGDKNLLNGQYCNGFIQRTVRDEYPEYEKDVLKQKMIEHEMVFKNQVYELHRVYRVQREMMEEAKRRELYHHHRSIKTSLSSNILPSQMPFNEVRNRQAPSFPLANSSCIRPSILGSDVIDSPSSCTKGHNSEADLFPYQNRCDPKELVFLDSRSSKVKKKLFDHQVPADKYIVAEKGEHFQDIEMSNTIMYPTSGDHRLSPESKIKKCCGGGKTNDLRDNSSDLRLKIPMLADLNEPIHVEDCDSPKIVNFSGHSSSNEEIRGLDSPAKPMSQFVDLSRDYLQNSQCGHSNGHFSNLSETDKGNSRGSLSYMYEAGKRGTDAKCIPKFYQSEQLTTTSQHIPFIPSKPNRHQGILPTDYEQEEPWTQRIRSYDFSNRSCGHSNNKLSGSFPTSHISKPFQWHNSQNVANSWSHSVKSWEKSNFSLTEKVTSLQTIPSQTSSRDINGSSRLNSSLGSKLSMQNGFCEGSSMVSKELPTKLSSFGYNNLKCNEIDVMDPKHLTHHRFKNVVKDSDVMKLKPVKGLDLNVVLPVDSLNEEALPRSNEFLYGKRNFENHYPDVPWLRGKQVSKDLSTITKKDFESGMLQALYNPLHKDIKVKDSHSLSTQNLSATSSSCHNKVNRESASAALNNGKLLEFPIFGTFCTSKNDTSCTSAFGQSSRNGVSTKTERNHRGFDINVACDLMDAEFNEQIVEEAISSEKGNDTKFNFRNIDLNSCVSEDEDILDSSLINTSGKVNFAFEIDLEAPVVLNTAEALCPVEQKQHEVSPQSQIPKTEQQADQGVRIAAEAIVAISSYTEDSHIECTNLDRSELPDSLVWFADVISSSAEELEMKLCRDYKGRNSREMETLRELDDYEAMTMQLTETREEDYMPKPFIPEIPNLEEAGANSVPSRTRKGPARRGRMRKDFQRDVLPGIVSLSRHEVTEDLQTFGGLMRATGHQWNGGTTRRNGTRGRRRCIVEPSPAVVVAPVCSPPVPNFNSAEVRVEDVSLGWWGKTTRRPRRQRSAAANNLAVAMT